MSHVLSARMSSRPMGWSRAGADAMAKLRIYVKNGGDLWDLVAYQKAEEPEPPEEPDVLSCQTMLSWEHKKPAREPRGASALFDPTVS